MAWRPRLPVLVLCTAVAGGLVGGWALNRAVFGDDGDSDVDSVVLAEPGEYQEPADGDNRDVDGERLPDVGLTDAEGLEISASSLVGQPLVVNLWYSTCIPCKRELGEFAAVHREVGDQVRFVGINPLDSVDVMERFAAIAVSATSCCATSRERSSTPSASSTSRSRCSWLPTARSSPRPARSTVTSCGPASRSCSRWGCRSSAGWWPP